MIYEMRTYQLKVGTVQTYVKQFQEKGLGLAPGNAFGLGGEGHVRLCFAVEEAILREALDRFEEGWVEYRNR